jgi:hypothetical protein
VEGHVRASNEGKVCEAIVQHLEKGANGAVRSSVRAPEKEGHAAPVEFAFKIGDQLHALEHTVIEPFAGHLKLEAQAQQRFKPIEDALKQALGKTAFFQLIIPADALEGKKATDLPGIQQAVINWVKTAAATMPTRNDGLGTSIRAGEVPGVGFPLELHRFDPTPIPLHYFKISHVVLDLDRLRKERMNEAIEKKFWKLGAWKRDERAKTVLVLENRDVQLSPPDVVADTFVPLAKTRQDRPDETYLVMTCFEPWHLWPILIGYKSYYDLVAKGPIGIEEVDPTKLVPLTAVPPARSQS